MCGIAGIVLKPNAAPLDLAPRLRAMAAAMRHRGPDDAGVFVADHGCAGLANVRLAVQDCSPAGHMPMAGPQARHWISYNGECYNVAELRPLLAQAGYAFQSSGDTEVILAAYHAWGAAMLPRLRAMFALAIWDARPAAETPLLLARDALGIKPLYYADTETALVFASELPALLASGLIARDLDPSALTAFLLLGSVPAPLTIYRGVRALEPGCRLSLAADGSFSVAPFYHLPQTIDGPTDQAAAAEYVRELLLDAVRSQLVSDVPLGAFLSGGLDSSAVAAMMRHLGNGTIRTCSMSFAEQEYDESAYALAVAQAIGAEHHERVLGPTEVLESLPQIIAGLGQPSIDGVNTYFIAQTARQAGLTVALSGLGGDELFGGYPNTFGGVPRTLRALRSAASIPAAAALAGVAATKLPLAQRWAKLAAGLDRPPSPASAYLVQRGLFSPGEVHELLLPEISAAASFDPVAHITQQAGEAGDMFAWVSRAELRTYTHHQLLRDTDVMSMAHSLEVRVPLLDDRLTAAVLQLPAHVKQGEGPKPLLRRAIGDLLPPAVRDRRDKRGFTLPFDRWLRNELRPQLDAWQDLPGILRPGAFAAARHRFETGRLHWSRLWALTVLQGWGSGQG